jgi:acyl-CoA thioester hydrolase
MPRVKLIEQEEYEHQYTVTVQPRDINFGGHLGHDAIISLVHVARAYLLHSKGFGELNFGDSGTGMVMSDLSVNYLAEGFMFDELRIDTHVGEFTGKSLRFFHRIMKGPTTVALVETGVVAVNRLSRKSVRLSQDLLVALKSQ